MKKMIFIAAALWVPLLGLIALGIDWFTEIRSSEEWRVPQATTADGSTLGSPQEYFLFPLSVASILGIALAVLLALASIYMLITYTADAEERKSCKSVRRMSVSFLMATLAIVSILTLDAIITRPATYIEDMSESQIRITIEDPVGTTIEDIPSRARGDYIFLYGFRTWWRDTFSSTPLLVPIRFADHGDTE